CSPTTRHQRPRIHRKRRSSRRGDWLAKNLSRSRQEGRPGVTGRETPKLALRKCRSEKGCLEFRRRAQAGVNFSRQADQRGEGRLISTAKSFVPFTLWKLENSA